SFRRQLVEVRRLARHDSAMVGADVEPADIVAHDDEDVRRSLLLLRGRRCKQRGSDQCREREPDGLARVHATLLLFATSSADAPWGVRFLKPRSEARS